MKDTMFRINHQFIDDATEPDTFTAAHAITNNVSCIDLQRQRLNDDM